VVRAHAPHNNEREITMATEEVTKKNINGGNGNGHIAGITSSLLASEEAETEIDEAPAKGGRARKAPAAKPAKEEKELKIKSLNLRIMSTEAVALNDSTLIVHAWSEKARREMLDRQTKTTRAKKEAKDPEADFNGARYILKPDDPRPWARALFAKYPKAKEIDCVPSAAFRNAFIASARYIEGVFMVTLQGSLFIDGGEWVPILDRTTNEPAVPVMRQDMVRVGGKAGPGSGVADIRFRPEYSNWKVPLRVQFNSNMLSDDQVANLINIAGFSVGVCEWRPEKRGDHGRFTLGEVYGVMDATPGKR
jgi:hypothetical protein